MMSWYTFPKQEGNDCKKCDGTGKQQSFDIDGTTIYHWMKPNVTACERQERQNDQQKNS